MGTPSGRLCEPAIFQQNHHEPTAMMFFIRPAWHNPAAGGVS
jgi:hypothetical protein